ncbi:MAG TPA: hypothetical protein VGQ81_02630 [Acidobacteriota bacterium]|nr:hypothetical protein [Acidobacteriota bacterium]
MIPNREIWFFSTSLLSGNVKNTRTQFATVCGSVDAGSHRAATGRERRADVTLCDYTSAELPQ